MENEIKYKVIKTDGSSKFTKVNQEEYTLSQALSLYDSLGGAAKGWKVVKAISH